MTIAPNNKLRPIHELANKRVSYQPEREPIIQTAIPHLNIHERLDGSKFLVCEKCTAELPLDYNVGGMKSRLYAFCDTHEECKLEVAS